MRCPGQLLFVFELLILAIASEKFAVTAFGLRNSSRTIDQICIFNSICRNATAARAGLANVNGFQNITNSSFYFVARVTYADSEFRVDDGRNTTNDVKDSLRIPQLNLTCAFDPDITLLVVDYNSTAQALMTTVMNLNCTNRGENITSTNYQNANKAEAKPFLKVIYIGVQLVVFSLHAGCFSIFAQLRRRKANAEIGLMPRAGGRWTQKGWQAVSHNQISSLKKVIDESRREQAVDHRLRAHIRDDPAKSAVFDRIGFSAQGFSYRQRVVSSHSKLEYILAAGLPRRRPSENLKQYLLNAVNRLELSDTLQPSDLRVHVKTYLKLWERATFGEIEFSGEDWSTFWSLFQSLCDRLRQLVKAEINGVTQFNKKGTGTGIRYINIRY